MQLKNKIPTDAEISEVPKAVNWKLILYDIVTLIDIVFIKKMINV